MHTWFAVHIYVDFTIFDDMSHKLHILFAVNNLLIVVYTDREFLRTISGLTAKIEKWDVGYWLEYSISHPSNYLFIHISSIFNVIHSYCFRTDMTRSKKWVYDGVNFNFPKELIRWIHPKKKKKTYILVFEPKSVNKMRTKNTHQFDNSIMEYLIRIKNLHNNS